MDTVEVRVELNDVMLQELIWHALLPDASVRLSQFLNAVEDQSAQISIMPAEARLTGVSVVMQQDKVYAELTYTPVGSAGTASATGAGE